MREHGECDRTAMDLLQLFQPGHLQRGFLVAAPADWRTELAEDSSVLQAPPEITIMIIISAPSTRPIQHTYIMSDFDGNRVLIGMRRRSLFSTSAAATAAAATAAADASVRRTVLRGEP